MMKDGEIIAKWRRVAELGNEITKLDLEFEARTKEFEERHEAYHRDVEKIRRERDVLHGELFRGQGS